MSETKFKANGMSFTLITDYLSDGETTELYVSIEEDCGPDEADEYGECDEVASFELDRAGAQTLGDLLIRYAKTGSTQP